MSVVSAEVAGDAGEGEDFEGYGMTVDVHRTQAALIPARLLRLALEVPWRNWPVVMDGAAAQALSNLERDLCAAELKVLRDYGMLREYAIIRPLSMACPPDAATMEKITGAVRLLMDCGLLAPVHDEQ